MKCSNCSQAADNRWELRLCADGRRKRVFHLCDGCDISLNAYILAIMGDPNAKQKMARYAEKVNAQ